jgi:peptidoglycan/LPS O-acetylase OafA/YrhL
MLSATSSPRPAAYLPQLDGLRAVAVACVMAFHFIPWVDRYAPLGTMGVRLFFVLSGFLITGILLSWRGRPLAVATRVFYLRRALRIFPLFYFVLIAAAALNIGPVRDTFGWHAAYLSNFYFYLRGDWHGSVSHLWSLAVEEQFYLVWPWLILCAPERWLRPVIVATIVAAPLSRLAWPHPMDSVLPTSCLDSLGLGALVALAASHKGAPYGAGGGPPYGMAGMGAAGAVLVAVTLALRALGLGGQYQVVGLDFGVSLLSAYVVAGAARGFAGATGRFLSASPVRAVGRISYGLYVYHGFTPYLLGRYVPGFIDMTWPLRALLLTAATGLIAVASWHLLEQPFLRLKSSLGFFGRGDREAAKPAVLGTPVDA